MIDALSGFPSQTKPCPMCGAVLTIIIQDTLIDTVDEFERVAEKHTRENHPEKLDDMHAGFNDARKKVGLPPREERGTE